MTMGREAVLSESAIGVVISTKLDDLSGIVGQQLQARRPGVGDSNQHAD